MRGFFEIGIYHNKTPSNLGTLWRSAYQLGASGIFVIGKRYPKQGSDTIKAYRHIPLREYEDFDHFQNSRPYDCVLIGIEIGKNILEEFSHPQRAIYLLGAEDNGLPENVLQKCQTTIGLSAINTLSYNVSVAGSIVMYHRQFLQTRL